MESNQFDRLARLSASAVDRRLIVRSLAAAVLAEVGMVGWANRVEAKSTDPGVRFFESLAAKMKEATGDCDALAQAADDFRREHLAEFNKLANQEQQWDVKKRSQVATKYQARITQATESLHTLLASCRFRGTSEAAICEASGNDVVTLPGEAQCGAGCDCACICPISGWDCAGAFFGCVGGSEASCCWFGACAGNICSEQCPNCCNCGISCCGC